MNAISLFSSGGVGDLGLEKNNIKTIINSELIENRMDVFKENFPDSKSFLGDIWEHKDDIIEYYRNTYSAEELSLILATPPCQGMSSNGSGKLLNKYRKGLRPSAALDERNRLIIPTMDIISELRPQWIIFENVPLMQNTMVMNEQNELINILDYIQKRLGDEYVGKAEVVESADYGVPQKRKRLITVFTKTKLGKEHFNTYGTFIPEATHAKNGEGNKKEWLTLRDVLYDLPSLDGKKNRNSKKDFHILHETNILDEKKYQWVENTKEGDTAFNNQCINPKCLYSENRDHGAKISKDDGVNRYNTDTPLYCEKCGSELPRPSAVDKKTKEKRIMKGYTSAYKRMRWDEPASTITQNFQYACSDNKLHPEQNRVLSIYEATVLQTIANYDYSFEVNGKLPTKGVIRDIIGESVPPKLIEIISGHLMKINNNSLEQHKQLSLF